MITPAVLLLFAAQVEVRSIVGFDLSLYRPAIDAGLGGATPYRDLFGSGRGPLWGGHAGALLDLGPDLALTLTLGASHFSVSASAFVDDGDASTPASTAERSGGETSLAVTPLALSAGLRLTTLFERLRVPLVPYAEAGPAWAYWSIARGDGGTAAEGGTWGLALGAGLLLELTGLDRDSRRTLRDDWGMSSVAVRAGVVRLQLDGFGATSALPLSDTAWTAGLELGF